MAKDRSEVAAGDRGEPLAHVDRMSRIAAEIAAINTLLHWGWIDGERLVKIGAGLLNQVEIPEDDDRQGGQK